MHAMFQGLVADSIEANCVTQCMLETAAQLWQRSAQLWEEEGGGMSKLQILGQIVSQEHPSAKALQTRRVLSTGT